MNLYENLNEQIMLAKAFREGKKAAEASEEHDTTSCPYRSGSAMYKEWFLGYAEGKQCRSN